MSRKVKTKFKNIFKQYNNTNYTRRAFKKLVRLFNYLKSSNGLPISYKAYTKSANFL